MSETKTLTIAPEYDQTAFNALRVVLDSLGAECEDDSWAVAGSQEISTWRFRIGSEQVVVELKAAKNLDDAHLAQCLNYLKASGLSICLLINFGNPKVEIKRIIQNH